jgi:NitT/TauT family transport system substrate-binding protein
LKFGLLPVADTILLIGAKEKGFFRERGLAVELVTFQSAPEKDAVAMSGELDGHFCEIISVIVQRASGKDFRAVAATSRTDPEKRVFGLVTSPGNAGLSLADLRGKDLLVARRTITDFLADVFWEDLGFPPDYMEKKDVRKIPVRMQLLLSDRAAATLIPEPMLSVAERAGGKVLADDRGLDMPLAVVALRGDLPDETVIAFREAIRDAVAWINENPGEGLGLMAKHNLIPPDLTDTYVLPAFDPAKLPDSLPDRALYERYLAYLAGIGVLAGEANTGGLRAPSWEDATWRAGE